MGTTLRLLRKSPASPSDTVRPLAGRILDLVPTGVGLEALKIRNAGDTQNELVVLDGGAVEVKAGLDLVFQTETGLGGDVILAPDSDIVGIEAAMKLDEQAADPAAVLNTGHVYTKDVAGVTELFYRDSTGAIIQLTSGGTILGNTLDGAYDEGGAGAGRTITADAGTVQITVTDNSNNAALTLIQNDNTNDPDTLVIENNSSSGRSIYLMGTTSASKIQSVGALSIIEGAASSWTLYSTNFNSAVAGVDFIFNPTSTFDVNAGSSVTLDSTTNDIVLTTANAARKIELNSAGQVNIIAGGAGDVDIDAADEVRITSTNDTVIDPGGDLIFATGGDAKFDDNKKFYFEGASGNYPFYIACDGSNDCAVRNETGELELYSVTGVNLTSGTSDVIITAGDDIICRPVGDFKLDDNKNMAFEGASGTYTATITQDSGDDFTIKNTGGHVTLESGGNNNYVCHASGAHYFKNATTTRMAITNASIQIYGTHDLLWVNDGGGDIGAAGAQRPDTVYVKTQVLVGDTITLDGPTETISTTVDDLVLAPAADLDLDPTGDILAREKIILDAGKAIEIGSVQAILLDTAFNTWVGTVSASASGAVSNTIMGSLAGTDLTSGDYNSLYGKDAGDQLTSGVSNILIGRQAGHGITTQNNNVLIGNEIGMEISGTNGNNVFMGYRAGRYANTPHNVVIGYEAYEGVTTATVGTGKNVIIGALAGQSMTTGYENTIMGYTAGQDMTTGVKNACFGTGAGTNITTGNFNTVIGPNAGTNVLDGDRNVIIGYIAGSDVDTENDQLRIGNGTVEWIKSDANGNLTIPGDFRMDVHTDNVSNPPSDAELDTIFGTPATVGAGYTAYIDDNGAGANFYMVVSCGAFWWIFTGTKAV